jgi:CRP-like cAMP-binding protein
MARDRIWYALARHGIEIPVATHAVRLTELPAPMPEPPAASVARRVACLERIGLLESLGPEMIRRLAESQADRVYAAGEQVIRQAAPGDSMFVVMSGRVEVTVRGAGDVETRLAVLGPGDHFGEMSLMTGAPRSATVTTLEETRLLEIGKAAFRELLARRPELVESLGAALQLRLAEREQAVAEQASRAATEPPDVFQKIREFFAM